MQSGTIAYDSLESRPLPKWLIDQRDGLNTYQPPKMEMKKDYSLQVSIFVTVFVILSIIVILTVRVMRKNKKTN